MFTEEMIKAVFEYGNGYPGVANTLNRILEMQQEMIALEKEGLKLDEDYRTAVKELDAKIDTLCTNCPHFGRSAEDSCPICGAIR